MPVPKEVVELVERFQRNRETYENPHFNETETRIQFLNPLFKALGWDVDNTAGYAEAYKDVIHEDAVKVGAATKAPDYCFTIGGARKFFLEAKKPAINLKDNADPAYQLRRYGWSAKLPVSVLANFSELAVYDCRARPDKDDKASKARIQYWDCKQYVEKWDEIAAIFSKDAILKGSFDKFAAGSRNKRGTAEVDYEFLKEIEEWRDLLAKNIALRNPEITQRQLNFSVQQTIDRIIFLRICEDRGIEPYGRLQSLHNGENTYKHLCTLFRQADDRYNSGLFHFRGESGRKTPPDQLTPSLNIDDKPLKDIFKRLYYPDSPYEFSVLSADILGQVYEQFLGKVIRLTAGGHAKVEDKPEVKKAGGVYYTPIYIVDYIVRQTIGELLEGKTTKTLKRLTVLDPACGSGSFLLSAYQYFLDWYLKQYINEGAEAHIKGRRPRIFKSQRSGWRLTTSERKRILLKHIYGVDIDTQAVEVTKLSLLLKVLEEESAENINKNWEFFHERALPDLESNIKCGNSLVSSNYYDGRFDFDEEERHRINAFDWKLEFPDILEARNTPSPKGFDAIIGNPPYVDIKALPAEDVKYLFSNYPCANNRINLFAAFIEMSLRIVNSTTFRYSMIIPTAFLTQESYSALRKDILDRHRIGYVARLPNESFGASAGDVKVDTCIVVIEAAARTEKATEILAYEGYERISAIDPTTAQVHGRVMQSEWLATPGYAWSLNTNVTEDRILKKCVDNATPLEDCADFSLGLTPYDKYRGHTKAQIENQVFHADHRKDGTFRKLLAGNDVTRYFVRWNGEKWISYGPWLGAPRERKFFTQRRILVKQIIDWTTKRIWATITEDELYNTQNAFNLIAKHGWNLDFLLGVLNSRLMTFYHRKKFLDEFKMRFQKILIKDCRRFPIRNPNPKKDEKGKAFDEAIAELVQKMLSLHAKRATAKTVHERNLVERQIIIVDSQIDHLVYELYGLTEAEVKIVDSAT